MAKYYEFDVNQIVEVESGEVLGYYTKGHHDEAEFLESLIYDYDILRNNPKLKEEDIQDNIRQIWAKLVPWSGGGMIFTYSDEYRNGYFPITQYEL